MSRLLLTTLALVVLCSAASAQTVTYGWEDGQTVLSLYGDGTPPIIVTNVGAPDPVHGGSRSLLLEDNSPSGTPQAYVAFIVGLQDGDEVTASFWRYDTTPSGSPSCRIWGHWNNTFCDIDGYDGSASGNDDYGPGTGWDETSWTYTVGAGQAGQAPGVVVHADLRELEAVGRQDHDDRFVAADRARGAKGAETGEGSRDRRGLQSSGRDVLEVDDVGHVRSSW